MKKYLLIALLLLAVTMSAVACGNDGSPAESGTDTTVESIVETDTAPAESEADTLPTESGTEMESDTETVPETNTGTEMESVAETNEETLAESAPESDPSNETTPESETAADVECKHSYDYSEGVKLDNYSHTCACTLCGEKKPVEHTWEEGLTTNGQTAYSCPACGATKLEGEYVPDTEPAETEAPGPFDPIYIADADALIPNFTSDSTQHITSAEKVEEHVHIIPTIGDPYYVPFTQINGARYVAIKYRTDNAEGMALQFYLSSTGTHPVDDTTMMRQPITGDGEWHVALFDTKPLIDDGYYDGSYVSYFRFDPMDCEYMVDENGEHYKDSNDLWARHELPVGAYIDIAYIAFFDTEADASLYENRPTHFVSADVLYENALVNENLTYNQFMYASMEDGYIKLTGTDTDSYVTAILPGTTDAVTTKYLFIKYRTSHKDLLGQVFTGSGEAWEGDQNKLNFPYEGDGQWHLLMVDLTPNETLTGNAGFLRYDFFQYGADPETKEEHSIDVQYLAFFENAEQAAAFDAAYEASMA